MTPTETTTNDTAISAYAGALDDALRILGRAMVDASYGVTTTMLYHARKRLDDELAAYLRGGEDEAAS